MTIREREAPAEALSVPKARLLSQHITSEIRKAILDGTLAPGSRIRQQDLAVQLSVSRIPVREALKQLENEGLVTLVPNSSAWVSKVDLEECIEIYKIRERLEPLALGESVVHISVPEIEEMKDILLRIEAATDVEEFLKYDREFHLLSYRGAKMNKLYSMIESYWNTTQHFRRAHVTLLGKDGLWPVHYEHRLLLEAISRRDTAGAENILASHIRRTRLDLQRGDSTAGSDAAKTPLHENGQKNGTHA